MIKCCLDWASSYLGPSEFQEKSKGLINLRSNTHSISAIKYGSAASGTNPVVVGLVMGPIDDEPF